MAITHKVVAAAANVQREAGPSQLIYRDAPVPSDATNLQELIDGGFVEKITADEVGGHPSDLPPVEPAAVPRPKPAPASSGKS